MSWKWIAAEEIEEARLAEWFRIHRTPEGSPDRQKLER